MAGIGLTVIGSLLAIALLGAAPARAGEIVQPSSLGGAPI